MKIEWDERKVVRRGFSASSPVVWKNSLLAVPAPPHVPPYGERREDKQHTLDYVSLMTVSPFPVGHPAPHSTADTRRTERGLGSFFRIFFLESHRRGFIRGRVDHLSVSEVCNSRHRTKPVRFQIKIALCPRNIYTTCASACVCVYKRVCCVCVCVCR